MWPVEEEPDTLVCSSSDKSGQGEFVFCSQEQEKADVQGTDVYIVTRIIIFVFTGVCAMRNEIMSPQSTVLQSSKDVGS